MKSFALAVSLGLFFPAAIAFADDLPPPKADAKPVSKPDTEGFVPVKEGEALGPGEVIPATGLVAGAYGFILGAMVVWVASVAMRTRRVEDDVTALRSRLDRAS